MRRCVRLPAPPVAPSEPSPGWCRPGTWRSSPAGCSSPPRRAAGSGRCQAESPWWSWCRWRKPRWTEPHVQSDTPWGSPGSAHHRETLQCAVNVHTWGEEHLLHSQPSPRCETHTTHFYSLYNSLYKHFTNTHSVHKNLNLCILSGSVKQNESNKYLFILY